MENKNEGKCPEKCLWYDQCKCLKICEDYTPLDNEEDEDESLDELIENKRIEFREEFFEYISEDDSFEDQLYMEDTNNDSDN